MNYYPYLPFNPNQFNNSMLNLSTNYQMHSMGVETSSVHEANNEESVRPWVDWEDNRLAIATEKFQGKGWRKIAMSAFPDNSRSKEECLKRWRQITKSVSVKGLWTVEEDSKLTQLVNELGAEKWVSIANKLTTRTGKQCRERWHNHLDPRINKAPFTKQEELLIFELHSKLGSKWAEISKHLVGRSDNSIKNFFNTAMQRKRKLGSGSKLQLQFKRKDRNLNPELFTPSSASKTEPTGFQFNFNPTAFNYTHPIGFNQLPLHLQLPLLTPPHTPQLLNSNFDLFQTPYKLTKAVHTNNQSANFLDSGNLESLPYLESSPQLTLTSSNDSNPLEINHYQNPHHQQQQQRHSQLPSSGLLQNDSLHSQPETPNNFNCNQFLHSNYSLDNLPYSNSQPQHQFHPYAMESMDKNNYLGLVNLNFDPESNQFNSYLNQ